MPLWHWKRFPCIQYEYCRSAADRLYHLLSVEHILELYKTVKPKAYQRVPNDVALMWDTCSISLPVLEIKSRFYTKHIFSLPLATYLPISVSKMSKVLKYILKCNHFSVEALPGVMMSVSDKMIDWKACIVVSSDAWRPKTGARIQSLT